MINYWRALKHLGGVKGIHYLGSRHRRFWDLGFQVGHQDDFSPGHRSKESTGKGEKEPSVSSSESGKQPGDAAATASLGADSSAPSGVPAHLSVAIVHYWFVNRRGGERVVEVLADMFPQADIFTLFMDADSLEIDSLP